MYKKSGHLIWKPAPAVALLVITAMLSISAVNVGASPDAVVSPLVVRADASTLLTITITNPTTENIENILIRASAGSFSEAIGGMDTITLLKQVAGDFDNVATSLRSAGENLKLATDNKKAAGLYLVGAASVLEDTVRTGGVALGFWANVWNHLLDAVAPLNQAGDNMALDTENLALTAELLQSVAMKLRLAGENCAPYNTRVSENMVSAAGSIDNAATALLDGNLRRAGDNLTVAGGRIESAGIAMRENSYTTGSKLKDFGAYLKVAGGKLSAAGTRVENAGTNLKGTKSAAKYLNDAATHIETADPVLKNAADNLRSAATQIEAAGSKLIAYTLLGVSDNLSSAAEYLSNAADTLGAALGGDDLVKAGADIQKAGDILGQIQKLNLTEAGSVLTAVENDFRAVASRIRLTAGTMAPSNWKLSENNEDLLFSAQSKAYHLAKGKSMNFTFLWKAPAEGTYTLEIWGYKPGAAYPAFGPLEVQVEVDGTPPTISVKVVQEGVEIPNLVGNKYDGGIAHVVIEANEEVSLGDVLIMVDNKNVMSPLCMITLDNKTFVGGFEVGKWDDNTAVVELTACDLVGNETPASQKFIVDTTPPIFVDPGFEGLGGQLHEVTQPIVVLANTTEQACDGSHSMQCIVSLPKKDWWTVRTFVDAVANKTFTVYLWIPSNQPISQIRLKGSGSSPAVTVKYAQIAKDQWSKFSLKFGSVVDNELQVSVQSTGAATFVFYMDNTSLDNQYWDWEDGTLEDWSVLGAAGKTYLADNDPLQTVIASVEDNWAKGVRLGWRDNTISVVKVEAKWGGISTVSEHVPRYFDNLPTPPAPDNSFTLGINFQEGPNTLSLTATDWTGNTTSVTMGQPVFIDTKPPVIEFLTITGKDYTKDLVDNVAVNTSTPTIILSVKDLGYTDTGIGVSYEGLTVKLDGNKLESSWIPAVGLFENTTLLSDGAHTLSVSATDGLSGAVATVGFNVDTIAPTLSFISSTIPLGTKIEPTLVNKSTSTITVDVEPGVTVEILVNGEVKATGVAEGPWSPTVTLDEGLNETKARAVDAAGNENTIICGYVICDTAPPVVSIDTPSDGAIVPSQTFTVSGTVLDETTSVSELNVGGVSVLVGANNSFITSVSAVEGPKTIIVIAVDEVGNVSTTTVSVTVDVTRPTAVITAPGTGHLTAKASVTVQGKAYDDVTSVVEATLNGEAVSLKADGTFSKSVSLNLGTNTITLLVKDKAGHYATDQITVVSDTQAPSVSITAPADGTTTDKASIVVEGQVTDEPPETGVTVRVSAGGTTQEVVPDEDGSFVMTVVLPEGVSVITVTAVDDMGNVGLATITVERTATPWATYAIIFVIIALAMAAIAIFKKR